MGAGNGSGSPTATATRSSARGASTAASTSEQLGTSQREWSSIIYVGIENAFGPRTWSHAHGRRTSAGNSGGGVPNDPSAPAAIRYAALAGGRHLAGWSVGRATRNRVRHHRRPIFRVSHSGGTIVAARPSTLPSLPKMGSDGVGRARLRAAERVPGPYTGVRLPRRQR